MTNCLLVLKFSAAGYAFVGFLALAAVISLFLFVQSLRRKDGNAAPVGVLLVGTSSASLLFVLLTTADILPKFSEGAWLPLAGAGAWLVFAALYFFVWRKKPGRDSENPEAAEPEPTPQEPWAEVPEPCAAPAEAGHSTGPRRAVSLPANESDGQRASEQTLKRVSAAKLAEAAKPQGPRADEVPSNPILPDGEVKIRCLACDKKMKADAGKFRKQRRCPSCKAEPFRYVTAV